MPKALVLPGGAALGAFQSGFLLEEKVKYDLIAGDSVGALVGAMVSQGKYQAIQDLWLTKLVDRDNIFTSNVIDFDGSLKIWPLLMSIFRWPFVSVADSTPLREILELNVIKHDLQVPTLVGSTSLSSFNYHTFDLREFDQREIIDVLMASSSFPGLFPFVRSIYEGDKAYKYMSDGGMGRESTLSSAVNWIKKNSDSPNDWHIDIISTRNPDTYDLSEPKNIVQVLYRSLLMTINNQRDKDFSLFLSRNELSNYTHFSYRIIQPECTLPFELDFRPESIEKSWNEGARLAYIEHFKT